MPRIAVGTDTVAIYTQPGGHGAVLVNVVADADIYIDTVSTLTADTAATGGRLLSAGQQFEDTLTFGGAVYARTASGTTSAQYIVRRVG